MKKITILIFAMFILCFSLVGCGDKEELPQSETSQDRITSSDGGKSNAVSFDLTTMSSTIAYSTVYNMLSTPEEYIGETVKMKGQFAIYTKNSSICYEVVIADATACCEQRLGFVLDGDYQYPDDYPSQGTKITVTGVFDAYEEDGKKYCRLIEGKMDIN